MSLYLRSFIKKNHHGFFSAIITGKYCTAKATSRETKVPVILLCYYSSDCVRKEFGVLLMSLLICSILRSNLILVFALVSHSLTQSVSQSVTKIFTKWNWKRPCQCSVWQQRLSTAVRYYSLVVNWDDHFVTVFPFNVFLNWGINLILNWTNISLAETLLVWKYNYWVF